MARTPDERTSVESVATPFSQPWQFGVDIRRDDNSSSLFRIDVDIAAGPNVFREGFESGDLSAWSGSTP